MLGPTKNVLQDIPAAVRVCAGVYYYLLAGTVAVGIFGEYLFHPLTYWLAVAGTVVGSFLIILRARRLLVVLLGILGLCGVFMLVILGQIALTREVSFRCGRTWVHEYSEGGVNGDRRTYQNVVPGLLLGRAAVVTRPDGCRAVRYIAPS